MKFQYSHFDQFSLEVFDMAMYQVGEVTLFIKKKKKVGEVTLNISNLRGLLCDAILWGE